MATKSTDPVNPIAPALVPIFALFVFFVAHFQRGNPQTKAGDRKMGGQGNESRLRAIPLIFFRPPSFCLYLFHFENLTCSQHVLAFKESSHA